MALTVEPASLDNSRVSDFWDEQFARIRADSSCWINNHLVATHLYRLISGGSSKHWLVWLLEDYFCNLSLFKRSLSICCGDGSHELVLHNSKRVGFVRGFDISEGAIHQANERFKAANAPREAYLFEVRDANNLDIDDNYDLVLSSGALHHVSNLEGLLDKVQTVLHPDGYFVLVEFVGPNRFQWTPQQCDLINGALAQLDSHYLKDDTRPTLGPPAVEEMIRIDPSEAVRSEDILPLVRQRFDVEYESNFNGTIMHMMYPLLNPELTNRGDRDFESVVRLLLYFEDVLIKSQLLPSDFVFMICRSLSQKTPPAEADGADRQRSRVRTSGLRVPGEAGFREMQDTLTEADLLADSDFFDAVWYKAAHPEAVDPISHYLHDGAAAGFDPSPSFSTKGYLNLYRDVAEAGCNPLVHYLRYGRAEGRSLPRNGSGSNPWNDDVPHSYTGSWFATKAVGRMINTRISGDPGVNWIAHVINSHVPSASDDLSCLILGSNEGYSERVLCEAGFKGRIIATDIADKALDRARDKARELGYLNIEHVVADLNTANFPGPFDLIIAEGVLHHIENIEGCLDMLNAALAPDGHLVGVEFEGPFRFQLSEKQVHWINAVLGVVPRRLRQLARDDRGDYPLSSDERQKLWVSGSGWSEEALRAYDPSEAISGPALKELMPLKFEMVRRVGFGGPILSYLAGHFDFDTANMDESAARWLDLLIQLERTLINDGILEDEFFFYSAGKRLTDVR
jgi:ubiquinone/menaquinone biosynthesis C-methylase UbiE